MGIFAFKSVKVEVWFQLKCASEQLVSMVTANKHFYVATFFLWYPNFIIGRGAPNRFLVGLILIETRAVLIIKVSPGVNIFMC